jgi:hypothetical protein
MLVQIESLPPRKKKHTQKHKLEYCIVCIMMNLIVCNVTNMRMNRKICKMQTNKILRRKYLL